MKGRVISYVCVQNWEILVLKGMYTSLEYRFSRSCTSHQTAVMEDLLSCCVVFKIFFFPDLFPSLHNFWSLSSLDSLSMGITPCIRLCMAFELTSHC